MIMISFNYILWPFFMTIKKWLPKLSYHFGHTWVQGQHVVHEAHGVGGGIISGDQDHNSGGNDVGLVVAPLAALVLDLDVINGLINW